MLIPISCCLSTLSFASRMSLVQSSLQRFAPLGRVKQNINVWYGNYDRSCFSIKNRQFYSCCVDTFLNIALTVCYVNRCHPMRFSNMHIKLFYLYLFQKNRFPMIDFSSLLRLLLDKAKLGSVKITLTETKCQAKKINHQHRQYV